MTKRVVAIHNETARHNLEAERAIIGAIVLVNDAADVIDLRASEFYDDELAHMFAVMQDMHAAAMPIDHVTLAAELEKRRVPWNASKLFDCIESVPHAQHVRYYARLVRACARVRAIVEACKTTLAAAQHPDADGDALLNQLDRQCVTIRETQATGLMTAAEAVDALIAQEANPTITRATGLADVDALLTGGGIANSQFIVLGGRPGCGKSMLGAQIIAHIAERGERALIVSLEMMTTEITARLVASRSREAMRELPLLITDRMYDIDSITSTIRLAVRRDRVRACFVDYLQLIEARDSRMARERQVAEVSRALKRLAMECEIPIVCACQLNRAAERDQRPPRLSDLRESGAIEQDADIVALLHVEDSGARSLVIAKQRNGPTGIVSLAFRPNACRFDNAARHSEAYEYFDR